MTVNLDQAPLDGKKYTVLVYTRKLSKSVLIVSLKTYLIFYAASD